MEQTLDLGVPGFEAMWYGTQLFWKHPKCRAWNRVEFGPDHHHLVEAEPLTISQSLLCPQGCGTHGYIRGGKWVPA